MTSGNSTHELLQKLLQQLGSMKVNTLVSNSTNTSVPAVAFYTSPLIYPGDPSPIYPMHPCGPSPVTYPMPAEVTDDSKWDEMDEKLISKSSLALADEILSKQKGEEDAKEIFGIILLDLTEHVNNLNTLFSQLTSLDCKIDPQERAKILLQRKKKNKFKCFKCGKQGHFKKDCRGSNTSNPQGNVASTSDDGNALCCEAAVANEGRKKFADMPDGQVRDYSETSTLGGLENGIIVFRTIGLTWLRCWVYPIKKKSDVFEVFKVYKARVELDSGTKIKCLRTDNGGEYTGDEFDLFCKQEGIKRQFTTAYTPQQNGVAERMNRTLLERARAMLATASLGKSFWAGKQVNTACYVKNRSPSTAVELRRHR
ncbi:gag-pol polyprotein [Tanacetum coccineum]